jgi:hypothetical protein
LSLSLLKLRQRADGRLTRKPGDHQQGGAEYGDDGIVMTNRPPNFFNILGYFVPPCCAAIARKGLPKLPLKKETNIERHTFNLFCIMRTVDEHKRRSQITVRTSGTSFTT